MQNNPAIKTVTLHCVSAFVTPAGGQQPATGGNPAGVVFTAGQPLTKAEMQFIAAQAGYAETAFITALEAGNQAQADFRVEFFTPTSEVDFCGHATLASFALMQQQAKIQPGRYTQITGAGLLAVEVSAADNEIWMDQCQPQFSQQFTRQQVAPLLGLQADALPAGLPPTRVSTGLPDLIIAVTPEQLAALKPDMPAIAAFSEQHQLTGLHVFALQTDDVQTSVHCRNFAPLFGIDEESATGSASGALACYLFEHQVPCHSQLSAPENNQTEFNFIQGETLEQPSQISVRLTLNQTGNDKPVIQRVQVGGSACYLQQSCIRL